MLLLQQWKEFDHYLLLFEVQGTRESLNLDRTTQKRLVVAPQII